MAKEKLDKIASSPTLIGLEKLLNQYCYSTTYRIYPDFSITNSKGIVNKFGVVKIKSRYVLYHKNVNP